MSMLRQLPPLNAVRAFEVAARNLSFTRAAAELCVSQGAVSRHIAILEDWVQAPLFRRVRGGVELTAQGASYFRVVRAALDQIEAGALQLRHSRDEHRLRLKLPPTFAMRWLVPRLLRFHARHPGIDVQITTSHEVADFNREDVDISIFSWAKPPSGSHHRRLLGEVLLPVCAPGLLKNGLPLETPQDLSLHVLLCSLNRPLDWPTWLQAAGVTGVDGNAGLKFENAALAYQAVIDELGVVISQLAFVEDDLKSGRLVAPFPLRARTEWAYCLGFHPERQKSARVQAFADWILAEAEECESRSSGFGADRAA
ncbi:transcriptional regulator GcvA [Bosea sp. 124]|uniref:transcriptional regulator GcvA n=1 Tax=Bosea sp. 124 TaxID=2135642 RepID=UPI000D43EA24|nr:transcriptional regulator GcvA [Bosea sp. 124]PTM43403.1 LysR family glycine cleavage system transcriptional activator [Bosea sp. 124]